MSNSRAPELKKTTCYPSLFAFSRGCITTTSSVAIPLAIISLNDPALLLIGGGVACAGGGIVEMMKDYQTCQTKRNVASGPKR